VQALEGGLGPLALDDEAPQPGSPAGCQELVVARRQRQEAGGIGLVADGLEQLQVGPRPGQMGVLTQVRLPVVEPAERGAIGGGASGCVRGGCSESILTQ
jgi:hypothetical protein